MAIGVHSVTRFLPVNGLTEDEHQVTMDWLFPPDNEPNVSQHDDVEAVIQSFWVDVFSPALISITSRYSPTVVRIGGARIENYLIPDAPGLLGSPVYVGDPFDIDPASSANGLPGEVAYVQGFRADTAGVPETAVNPSPPPATIRPGARRRGRMYLGPLTHEALATTGSPIRVEPADAFRLAVRESTRQALGLAAAAVGWEFGVWSRADWIVRPVVMLTDDNAFDTQRRRGRSPTSVTSTAFPGV